MKHKLFLSSVLLCAFLLIFSMNCLANEAPRKIAIVPTVSQTGANYPDIEAYCDHELYQSLRIPLNGVLHRHEYLAKDKILTALPEILQPEKLHKFTPSKLKDVADELGADLIVGFVINDLGETRQFNWHGKVILYSYVTLELIGYDRQKDAFLHYRQHEYFQEEESAAGHVLNLAKTAADKLLKKADFRKDIFPLSSSEQTT